jgi:benzoyl-CoA reductase/2-hydroxyglutaryl-CoA dehydratase subunit BcrC/BadD/HgdB
MDTFQLGRKIAGWELKYLKIETDYSTEVSRNLLTRLETFRSALAI